MHQKRNRHILATKSYEARKLLKEISDQHGFVLSYIHGIEPTEVSAAAVWGLEALLAILL